MRDNGRTDRRSGLALGVIPARGGSKRVPRKNLYPLGGLPLIAHSILAAREAGATLRQPARCEAVDIADHARPRLRVRDLVTNDLAEEVAAAVRARGGAADVVDLDVRDAGRFQAVVRETIERTGRLDYLFNNAGIGIGGEASAFDAADWDDVIDVNLRGVAHGILAAYPPMIRQGFGHIVNTASMAGLAPAPLQLSYTATKHAVVGLSRALRVEAKRLLCRPTKRCKQLGGRSMGE